MTNEKTKKLLDVVTALHDIIKASGTAGIPSGHLYARLMDKMPLHTYQSLIDILVRSKCITNKGHLLTSL